MRARVGIYSHCLFVLQRISSVLRFHFDFLELL